MAVKKTAKAESSAKTAAPKKAAPKKSATAAKAAAPRASSAPKASASSAKAAPKKKAAPVKLTDRQAELLKRVKDAGEAGYTAARAEGKGLESLTTKKLIKRGKKDKASGNYSFSVSKAGEKHLSTPPAPKD